jgi:hypothetical protein
MRLKKNYNNNNYDKRSYSIKDNEQSGKVNWWFNELDSLGIKNNNDIGVVSNDKSSNSNKTKPVSSQELEDLTDDIKQSFIRDYKTCYSE